MTIKDLLKLCVPDVYFSIRLIDSEGVTIHKEMTTAERFTENRPVYSKMEIEKLAVDKDYKEVVIFVKERNIHA